MVLKCVKNIITCRVLRVRRKAKLLFRILVAYILFSFQTNQRYWLFADPVAMDDRDGTSNPTMIV